MSISSKLTEGIWNVMSSDLILNARKYAFLLRVTTTSLR